MTWWQMAILVAGGMFLLCFTIAVSIELYFQRKEKFMVVLVKALQDAAKAVKGGD